MASINLEFIYYQIYLLLTGQLFSLVFIFEKLSDIAIKITPLSTIFSLVFLVGIFYCYSRLHNVEHAMLAEHEEEIIHSAVDMPNKRWTRIIDHLNSDNESDWRLAILEADLILEEMLEKMGYQGDTIGEKLRGVEKSDFNSINEAWEAHRIRNQIAHEGGNFRIDNREARRVVSLYERAFKEFHFV